MALPAYVRIKLDPVNWMQVLGSDCNVAHDYLQLCQLLGRRPARPAESGCALQLRPLPQPPAQAHSRCATSHNGQASLEGCMHRQAAAPGLSCQESISQCRPAKAAGRAGASFASEGMIKRLTWRRRDFRPSLSERTWSSASLAASKSACTVQ